MSLSRASHIKFAQGLTPPMRRRYQHTCVPIFMHIVHNGLQFSKFISGWTDISKFHSSGVNLLGSFSLRLSWLVTADWIPIQTECRFPQLGETAVALWSASEKLQTDWLLSCLFLLCDRLLDLFIWSIKCLKFIIVINRNCITIPYRDCFIAQPYCRLWILNSPLVEIHFILDDSVAHNLHSVLTFSANTGSSVSFYDLRQDRQGDIICQWLPKLLPIAVTLVV